MLLVLERVALGNWLKRTSPILRHAYLILAVLISWVFFRADNLSHAVKFLSVMFGAASVAATETKLAVYLNAEIAVMLVIGVLASLPVFPAIRTMSAGERWKRFTAVRPIVTFARIALYLGIFSLAVLWLASGTHNPFIYFRF